MTFAPNEVSFHPYGDAYKEGKEAFFKGWTNGDCDYESNPYTGVDQDAEWEDWNNGFNNAGEDS